MCGLRWWNSLKMTTPAPTIDEFITEIISFTHDKRPWLIVEGESDVLFFEQRFSNKHSVLYEQRKGWEGVTELIKEWNKISTEEKNGKIIIGVIDRDFHDLLGTNLPKNLVVVDHKDIEIMMFENDEALYKVLLEFGSREKLPLHKNQVDLSSIRKTIYELALPLTKLRLANALLSNINLSFEKPFNFKNIINLRPLTMDLDSLINRISIHSCCSKEALRQALLNEVVNKPYPYHTISNGHDIMCLLGKSLQKYFGSISESKLIEGEKLEGHFRLSYPNSDFEKSRFGQQIITQLGLTSIEPAPGTIT